MMIRNNTKKINKSINIKEGTNDGAHKSAMFIHKEKELTHGKSIQNLHSVNMSQATSHILAGAMVGISFVSLVVQFATFVRGSKSTNEIPHKRVNYG